MELDVCVSQSFLTEPSEWFGNYVVGQRVASRFVDLDLRVFIAGDVFTAHIHYLPCTHRCRQDIVTRLWRPREPTQACTIHSTWRGS